MDRLKTLRKDLLEMSPAELREHVRRIRVERRVYKEKPAAKRKAKVKSNKSASKVVNMLHTLTPEEIRRLLGEVDDDGGSGNTNRPNQGRQESP
jgi:hypothetical protein